MGTSLKDLQKILKICRETQVEYLKYQDIEIKLTPSSSIPIQPGPMPVPNKTHVASIGAGPFEGMPNDEEMLFASSPWGPLSSGELDEMKVGEKQ